MFVTLRVVELFAGVGGFRIGFEGCSNLEDKIGFKVIWANQWEPATNVQHAAQVYVTNWNLSPTDDPDVYGNGGDDIISGGAGDDTIEGGAGADTLDGGEGNDRLDGGQGRDILTGGNGNDILFGRGGDDQLFGGAGNDELRGNAGNDYLYGGAGSNTLFGGNGDDVFAFNGDDVGNGFNLVRDYEAGDTVELFNTVDADVVFEQVGNSTLLSVDGNFVALFENTDANDIVWSTVAPAG